MPQHQLDAEIAGRTDVYFNRTRAIVERFGDRHVTYAVFLRRPVISAPRLALDWLSRVSAVRGTSFEIARRCTGKGNELHHDEEAENRGQGIARREAQQADRQDGQGER